MDVKANAKVPVAEGYHGKIVGTMEKAGVPTTQNDDVIVKTEVPGTAGYHRNSVHISTKTEFPGTAGYHRNSVHVSAKAEVPGTAGYHRNGVHVSAKAEVPGTLGYHRKSMDLMEKQKSRMLSGVTLYQSRNILNKF